MIDIDIDIDNDMTYNIQTEEYKTATTCGILVKNIFEKDYGNWRLEDNLQITYLM